ncbi:hypothetical protein A3765_10240 [Oleiphilus sp. HI0130]|nr:hypothetical protein A3765_10240 [Oleiphilus sp. HI0130]
MGKALIVTEQGAGEYTAQVIYDTARAALAVSSLGDVIADIATKLTGVNAELATKQAEINAIQNELDAAINAGQEPEVLFEIVEKLAGPSAEAAKVRAKKNALLAEKLAAQKRIDFINANTPATENITMWCADYTEGLTGEVGTMEVNGSLKAAPIIFPNEIANSAYNQARDAQMQPIVSSGAPAVYFNRALLPGWQKWLPTYRVGTITAKSGDSCSVTLDAATGQQDLNINQTPTLNGVPIEYMTQNGLVFEVGDRVVVKFTDQNWTQPRVIGFESHPKPELSVWLLNDTFSTAIDSPFIRRHTPTGGSGLNITNPPSHNGVARRLERSGSDLYYYLYDSDTSSHNLVRTTSSGSITGIASNCDRMFGVNSTHVFYYEANFQIYSKKIIKRDRLTGALIGSFDATIPGHSVGEEERPVWISCNDQYVYWAMSPDTYNNAPVRICRSDLDGLNHELVAAYPFPGASTGGDGSWRWLHLTNDRIYMPDGKNSGLDSNAWFAVNCFVYDLDMNYIGSFGPLPFANGLNGTSAETCEGFAANDALCVWIEDNYNFGVYLHAWDRVVERDGNGDITSESWVKRTGTLTNIRSTYGGIKGGITV